VDEFLEDELGPKERDSAGVEAGIVVAAVRLPTRTEEGVGVVSKFLPFTGAPAMNHAFAIVVALRSGPIMYVTTCPIETGEVHSPI
jgi:hypothetical protein